MTKIAHLKPEQEQDGAIAKRTEERLTRVARATANVGADVARESVEVAQRTADVAEDMSETTRKLAEKSPVRDTVRKTDVKVEEVGTKAGKGK